MITLILIILIIAILIYLSTKRYYKTISSRFILMGDIIMIFSSAFASWAILSYLLTQTLKVDFSYISNIIFFLIFSVITLFVTYLLYKKDIKDFNFIWLLCEAFMSYGISIVSISLIYLYLGTGHVPDEILKTNFYGLFLNEEQNNIKLIHFAGNLISLFIGGSLILFSLVLNAKRITDLNKNI